MDKKPKAGSDKKKANEGPTIQKKEQSERFKKMARELNSDETGKLFSRAFSKLLKIKSSPDNA